MSELKIILFDLDGTRTAKGEVIQAGIHQPQKEIVGWSIKIRLV